MRGGQTLLEVSGVLKYFQIEEKKREIGALTVLYIHETKNDELEGLYLQL